MFRTLLITISLGLANVASTQVTLNTRLGKITGLVSNVNGTRVSKFLGIPYAKPPVGHLRFAKPQAFGAFKTLNATTYGNACMQLYDRLNGDEDCLTLNVFTPADISSGSKKPVMVWIHGGAFEIGDASSYPSEILSGFGDVVVVAVQYRLGVFGFLSTGDSILPGNLGLWDQRLALLWVKENIDEYGGNSSSVTIFGESAGGSSVAYHLFSPHNNASLFQRAILQSSWNTEEMLNRDPLQLTSIFTKAVNCTISQRLVSCLQSKSATHLLENYNKLPALLLKSFPIADGDFLPRSFGYLGANFTENPKRKFEKTEIGNFADFDVFGGWNDQEGLLYMLALKTANNMTDLKEGVSEKVFMDAMKFLVQNNKYGEVILKTARNFYFNNPQPKISERRPIEDQRIEMFAAMTGDFTLKVPMIQWLQIHSSLSKRSCFAYEYRVRRSNPTSFLYEGPDWLRVGANHGDEIASVFGFPFYKDLIPPTNSYADNLIRSAKYTDQEKAVSRKVLKIWTNFAKHGHPGREFDKFRYPVGQRFTRIFDHGLYKSSYPLNNVLRLWNSLFTASQ